MQLIRWTPHAVAQLSDRDIDPTEAERTLAAPEFELPDAEGRRVCMRRYFDARLGRQMLLRIVVDDTPTERVVVTVYKTSKFAKYLKGLAS